jgi:hypothetical protein
MLKVASGSLACSALVALALPTRAHAEFLGRAAATVQFESNWNLFDLDSGVVPTVGNYSRPPADNYFAYGAELTGIYVFGRQNFYARLVTKDFNYQRFPELDHNEYEAVARYIWKLFDNLDGTLGVTRTHSMVPFLDLSGTQLSLSVETQQTESALANLKLSHDWALEGTLESTKSNQPVSGAPDLQLTETAGTAHIKYLGIGRLTSGLMAGYSTGSYDGSLTGLSPSNPSYSQSQAALEASFLSKRSIYEGQIGYTRRTSSAGTDNSSGLTGLFDFTYQLTAKTAWRVKIDREVNSYILTSGSELDTDAGAGINWKASHKLSVDVDYTFSYRDFSGQTATGAAAIDSNRIDRQQQATAGIVYQPQRWILIRPYATVQIRHSSLAGRDSNSTIYGVSVTVMTSDQANKNSVGMESHWH